MRFLALQKALNMFTHSALVKVTIEEKQPLVGALRTLNLKSQPTSLYWLTKKLNETYKLIIQLAKKTRRKWKITKHANWLIENFNETYKLTIQMRFQLWALSSRLKVQSCKAKTIERKITMDSSWNDLNPKFISDIFQNPNELNMIKCQILLNQIWLHVEDCT